MWIDQAKALLERSLHPIPQELNELDWKIDISNKEDKIQHHLSAFANLEGGGFLVFGIDKSGCIIGIDQETAMAIVHKLGNVARDGLEPSITIEHSLEEYMNLPILFIHIPESREKPVHLRGYSLETAFIRSGTQTRKMDLSEIRQSLIRSHEDRYEELLALTSLDPNEALSYLDYVRYCEMLNVPVPRTENAIIDFLIVQKLLKRHAESYAITNLGVLICAKEIQKFPGKERKGIRVIKYKGADRITTEREMEGRKGYAIGFEGLITHIKTLLPESEVIKDSLRKTVSVYPEITIREIVANALIHQDLLVHGMGPTIEIFSDRMEITNPGKLLPTIRIERLIDTAPESRNELLAAMMRRLRICEERGSGIDKALLATEIYGMPPPEFIEGENYFKVILYSPKPFNKMTREERIRACYYHCCLKYVANDRMTNTTLRERFKIQEKNYPMISKIISDTIEKGLIKLGDPDSKSKKYAYYIPFWV